MNKSHTWRIVLVAACVAATCLIHDRFSDATASQSQAQSGHTPPESPQGTSPYPERHKEFLTRVFDIEQEYKSMKGPWEQKRVFLEELQTPELLWITSFKTTMVSADGKEPAKQDFMCHTNLDWDTGRHKTIFGLDHYTSSRVFTISQGQPDIDLPEGFGIPVMSHERLNLVGQVLNLNPSNEKVQVRHKIEVSYALDSELEVPMKPLNLITVYGMKLLHGTDGYPYLREGEGDPRTHGSQCLPGTNANATTYNDGHGRQFTGHWVIAPGERDVNPTLVTGQMNLSRDTTVHYIAVHTHALCESITLNDLTTGEVVFHSRITPLPGRLGIQQVGSYSSPEGIPLYKDHEYQLVSVFENTTQEDQDLMAVLFLYSYFHEFDKSKIQP